MFDSWFTVGNSTALKALNVNHVPNVGWPVVVKFRFKEFFLSSETICDSLCVVFILITSRTIYRALVALQAVLQFSVVAYLRSSLHIEGQILPMSVFSHFAATHCKFTPMLIAIIPRRACFGGVVEQLEFYLRLTLQSLVS